MRLRGFIIIGAITSIIVGFTLGKIVTADAPAPGSKEDPVVSKSYVDKALEERMTELENSVAELTVQAQSLQKTINQLQTRINNDSEASTKPPTATTPTTPTNSPPSTTTPSTPNDPTKDPANNGTNPPGNESVVGKTAYINTQNYLNMRSAPTTEAGIVQKLTKDDAMLIQKVEDSWYHVKLKDGTVGWVASWLVTIK
jgi:TolA-binding protein